MSGMPSRTEGLREIEDWYDRCAGEGLGVYERARSRQLWCLVNTNGLGCSSCEFNRRIEEPLAWAWA